MPDLANARSLNSKKKTRQTKNGCIVKTVFLDLTGLCLVF